MRQAGKKGARLALSLVLVMLGAGCVPLAPELGGIMGTGVGAGALDERTVAAGLREALRVGTDHTVLATARVDGYLGNALIRIALPEQLQSAAATLRTFGLGAQVEELETGMNRAAEIAAGEARQIFWDAVSDMSIADAFGILRGHQTAATDYFRDRSGQALRARFQPIVADKIGQINLSRVYGRIADVYNGFAPAGSERLVDLESYVTDRALDGLFTVLGQEERRIREDPLARSTDLLKRVFGQ
jgi:hypothetical protein